MLEIKDYKFIEDQYKKMIWSNRLLLLTFIATAIMIIFGTDILTAEITKKNEILGLITFASGFFLSIGIFFQTIFLKDEVKSETCENHSSKIVSKALYGSLLVEKKDSPLFADYRLLRIYTDTNTKVNLIFTGILLTGALFQLTLVTAITLVVLFISKMTLFDSEGKYIYKKISKEFDKIFLVDKNSHTKFANIAEAMVFLEQSYNKEIKKKYNTLCFPSTFAESIYLNKDNQMILSYEMELLNDYHNFIVNNYNRLYKAIIHNEVTSDVQETLDNIFNVADKLTQTLNNKITLVDIDPIYFKVKNAEDDIQNLKEKSTSINEIYTVK